MPLVPPGVNMVFASRGGGGGGGNVYVVESKSYSAPPGGSHALGETYIVKSPGSGLWAGHDNELATWDGSGWTFTVPDVGDLAFVIDEGIYYGWDGTQWFSMAACCPQRVTAAYTDGAYHTIASIPVTDGRVVLIDLKALARRTDSPGRAGYVRRAIVYREGGGATLQNTVDSPFSRESDPTYDVTIGVLGNNIEVRVRGRVGHSVNWSVAYTIEEVS